MSLVRTTLSGALTADAKKIRVASATTFAAGRIVKVDSELMLLQAVNPDVSTEWNVLRGYNGTTAVAHNTGAPCTVGLNTDWPTPAQPPQTAGGQVFSYAAAGAITPAEGQHQLLTGAASAMTLALPSLADDGIRMLIVSGDAQAYTVVVPTAFQGADTGVTATFGGAAGDNFLIEARNGLWVVIAVGGVSIA